MNIELNEKELTELGQYAINVVKNDHARLDVGKGIYLKINELLSNRIIEIRYLKISEVKFNTKEKIKQISQDAIMRLLTEVLQKHLDRKPTNDDFAKLKFSHETGNEHSRFVYFPEGEYLGQYMNVKDGEYFKLVFKFG